MFARASRVGEGTTLGRCPLGPGNAIGRRSDGSQDGTAVKRRDEGSEGSCVRDRAGESGSEDGIGQQGCEAVHGYQVGDTGGTGGTWSRGSIHMRDVCRRTARPGAQRVTADFALAEVGVQATVLALPPWFGFDGGVSRPVGCMTSVEARLPCSCTWEWHVYREGAQ